jgi:predicted RNA-binding Zn ribbon-like protein
METEQRGGFIFVGNQIALDFLNTHPVLSGEPTELLSDPSALLRWFVAARLLNEREARALERGWGETAARNGLEAARSFRERLRHEVIAWEEGKAVSRGMLAELNQTMGAYPMRMQIECREGVMESRLKSTFKEPQSMLGPLAHEAAMLFSKIDRSRVRQCGECVLHFYDNSKKGNRRWCSMKFCGNRVKVAAYASRKRERSEAGLG